MDVDLQAISSIVSENTEKKIDFENWNEKDASAFIEHLSSLGLERLAREEAHLKEEKTLLLRETCDLVHENYKIFINSAECSHTIHKQFTDIDHKMTELQTELPHLQTQINNFSDLSENISHLRHMTSLTLSKHTQLLEFLEFPSLMETCVRSGYYDEALEILAYLQQVEIKHKDIKIVNKISTDVKNGSRQMLIHLLHQLGSALSLPQCLRIMGLLRRLDVYPETELRMKFLQARDAWFCRTIKEIPKEDPFVHITKVIEAFRLYLFDIITQYKALFSDEDHSYKAGANIFETWIQHKKVSVSEFSKAMQSANIKFEETLSCYSFMETSFLDGKQELWGEVQSGVSPPLSLMDFPPLAVYTNGVTKALNSLRHCCQVALLHHVVKIVEKSVAKVISALLELHRLEGSGFTEKEATVFQRMVMAIRDAVLPFFNSCLRLMFPLQTISDVAGVPVSRIQAKKVGQIDIESVMAPMSDFPKTDSQSNEINNKSQHFIGINEVNIDQPSTSIDISTLPTSQSQLLEENQVCIDNTKESNLHSLSNETKLDDQSEIFISTSASNNKIVPTDLNTTINDTNQSSCESLNKTQNLSEH